VAANDSFRVADWPTILPQARTSPFGPRGLSLGCHLGITQNTAAKTDSRITF
jgi:hypothetical protein